ncbi:MAG: helix-turn-helix domain-containing protein [Anaerolineae bacterium]|jgi:excisionase family DNA binding protein|nr:helix-turn-helix domain-containing protein [Anaerolineae bacterium]
MSKSEPGKSTTMPRSLQFFTIAETAAILNVSRKLVSNWIHEGVLPAIRLGPGQRLLRIRQEDLVTFIDQGRINSGHCTTDEELNDTTQD